MRAGEFKNWILGKKHCPRCGRLFKKSEFKDEEICKYCEKELKKLVNKPDARWYRAVRKAQSRYRDFCPYCKNDNVIKYGLLESTKQQRFLCKSCNKTFSRHTFFPKTKIPFEFIAFVLYMIERTPTNPNMKTIFRYVNNWLNLFSLGKKHISLHTLYNWRHDYESIYKEYISWKDAKYFFDYNFKKAIPSRDNIKGENYEIIVDYDLYTHKWKSYKEFLIWFENNYTDKEKKRIFRGSKKEIRERMKEIKRHPFLKLNMKWVEKQ
jgi:transposase-like protein